MASTKGKGSMISTQKLQIMVYNEILMILTKIPSMFFFCYEFFDQPSFVLHSRSGRQVDTILAANSFQNAYF